MGRLIVALLALTACGDDADEPGLLEIGIPDAPCTVFEDHPSGCALHVLADGDTLPVMPGPGSYVTVYPSVRTKGVDPHAPEVHVTITVDDFLLGAEVPVEPSDMIEDGERAVLWNVAVRMQAELCCFDCSEGLLEARLVDAKERTFQGSVRVQLARAECPDPSACCESADTCPAPLTAQVCE